MTRKNYLLAPSLLSANFARLGDEATAVLQAGADLLHFDVMDNHYVDNLTVGPLVCKSLRDFGITAPIDVHLMVKPVDRLICDFAQVGANRISIHPDATQDLRASLQLIRDLGCKAGIAINPDANLEILKELTDAIDLVLIMGVNPGFGGQTFIPSTLHKIRKAHEIGAPKNIEIALDGGVKLENIKSIAEAGADTIIAGSAIFSANNYSEIINAMRKELAKVNTHE